MAVNAAVNWQFALDAAGAMQVKCDVYYTGSSVPGGTTLSTIAIPIVAGDTVAQMGAKIIAAVNAEAARRGSAVGGNPTNIYAQAFGKIQ